MFSRADENYVVGTVEVGNTMVLAQMIAEKTGASTATISRVNRSLNYGNDGYDMVFARMKSWQAMLAEQEKKD